MKVSDFIPEWNYDIDEEAIATLISGKTILITGAAGSIGSTLAERIAEYHPGRLVLLDIAETPLHHLGLRLKSCGVSFYSYLTDIRDRQRLNAIFEQEKPQMVIHAAAYKHVGLTENNPHEAVAVNTLGTANVLDIALQHNVANFVHISTDKAVNPISVLGITKFLAELYVLNKVKSNSQTRLSVIRFGNVFNSNGSVIETFTNQLLNGEPVTLTDRRAERYFISISDVTKLVLQTAVLHSRYNLFTFEMGKPVKIEAILNKLISHYGIEPSKILEVGLSAGEKLQEELYLPNAQVQSTSHSKIISIQEETHLEDIEVLFNRINDLIVHIHSPLEIKKELIKLSNVTLCKLWLNH